MPASQTCPTCALLSLQPKEPTLKRTARVEQLLRGNHAPLDVELKNFRLVVEKSPEILQNLDQKIAQAKETLDYLVAARHQAEEHATDAKSLLHPMRSLPTEVMSEIFSHCVPRGYINDDYVDSLAPRSPPWTLSHVCSRWRSLALSSPQLWTYFELDFEDHQVSFTTHQSIYKMILFFDRSKGLPLRLVISNGQDIANHPVFAILETTIPRWKDLTLDDASASLLQSFSGNVFPCLERLVLPPDLTGLQDIELPLFSRTSTPALRVFEADAHRRWSFDSLPLPWSQITTILDFTASDTDRMRRLQDVENLEHLTVVIGMYYKTMDGVCCLPSLRRLSVTEKEHAEAGDLASFLSALDLPTLQDLTLEFAADEDFRVVHFPRSLDRATNTLTKLCISHVGRSLADNHLEDTLNLLEFLSHTDCVEELVLRTYPLTIEFISGMTVGAPSSMLPRLRVLDIGDGLFCDVFSEYTSAIYNALLSRIDLGDPAEASRAKGGAADDPRVNLERLCVPHWLFLRQDAQWKEICGALKVECGLTR